MLDEGLEMVGIRGFTPIAYKQDVFTRDCRCCSAHGPNTVAINTITLLGWLRITYNGTTPEDQFIMLSRCRTGNTQVRDQSLKYEARR